MRISDWSSDVCSSDLQIGGAFARRVTLVEILAVEKIIDEDEGVGRIGTRVETDRRSGPVRRELALDLVMERPRTIAHPEHQRPAGFAPDDIGVRSEEHTSELQSLMRISYAVFCLKK